MIINFFLTLKRNTNVKNQMVKISNICFAKDKYFDLESDLFFLNENKQTRNPNEIRNATP